MASSFESDSSQPHLIQSFFSLGVAFFLCFLLMDTSIQFNNRPYSSSPKYDNEVPVILIISFYCRIWGRCPDRRE